MVIFSIVLLAAFAAGVWIYNRLVGERNQVRAAWSDIDVQLSAATSWCRAWCPA